ncbi:MAG: bifunctional hydroxymethylpyrimidine kinase/phosphomethylpyrimidine kinase [Acidimicrobiia bacterium]|nr:bifunctional hydroxymethylpyrimidine kinase/phosphomethylpyrimidine kinase [Acidimicrobiia bacterium]
MVVALTIAGSDSGGGAGIQADLKTLAALGVYGTSAITAITAQNTRGVTAVQALEPAMVVAQIDAVASDLRPAATKIGMLANAGIIHAVVEALSRLQLPNVVLDPVMVAKGGDHLLDPAAVSALRDALVPLATVVTPNVPEAEVLTGLTIVTTADLHSACRRLVGLGAQSVLVKGGHLKGSATDVWSDGSRFVELSAERIDTAHTHGTGCTLSSAIAAGLARGLEIEAAIRAAKDYVTGAIRHAPGLGGGHGPLGHFWHLTSGI